MTIKDDAATLVASEANRARSAGPGTAALAGTDVAGAQPGTEVI
jgi:hypothetical protein